MILRIASIIIFFSFVGCSLIVDNEQSGAVNYLPAYSGASGEVLVIMKDSYWNGSSGSSVKQVLESNIEFLSSPEPKFNLIQISRNQFGDLFRNHRNLLFVNIGEKSKEKKAAVNILKNKWSKGQLIVEINAKSEKAFNSVIQERSKQITDLFDLEDLYRNQKKFRKQKNEIINAELEKKYGFSIVVPADCKLAVSKKNFIWIKRDRKRILTGKAGATHDINQNILISIRDYTDSTMFNSDDIINYRDSIGKKFVPGPIANSYMSTEKEHFIPRRKEFNWHDRFSVEIRGMWKLEGFFMGGPFVSVTTLDRDNKRLITIEGNVFAPKFSKREYMRELEAMIYSFKEIDKKPS